VAVITYADLAVSGTNSCVVTNLVTDAKQSYELIAMLLKTPFVDDATNAHNSTLITVGDGSDADLYLTSTELNSNGTEVFLKFPRSERTLTTVSATRTNVTGVTINTATLNYAATNAPTVTVTPLTQATHAAGTNAPTVTVTPLTQATHAAGTNAPTVTVTPLTQATHAAGTNAPTIVFSFETLTLTNMVWDAGATTGTVAVITNVTATLAVTDQTLTYMTNATATATLTDQTLTYMTNATAAATLTDQTLTYMTNATAAATVTAASLAVGTNVTVTTAAQASLTSATDAGSDFGRNLVTAAGIIKTTFTGTLPYALSALDAGEVRLYFRVKDAANSNP
jgi:hypothetical protein